MPMLTDVGEVRYNGYTFPTYTTTKVSMRPVLDRARRATKYVTYTVTCDSHITCSPGDTVDAQLADIRKRLTQRGGVLEVFRKGFGTFTVNKPGGPRDVAMGPHPEIISAHPIGSRNAWVITWSVTASVPECLEGTAVTEGRVMAFNYTWSVSQDERGFSTRTITGELEIPLTVKVGENTGKETADRYWTQVMASIPPVPSFRRHSSHTLSEDRRTISFTVVDAEQPADAFVAGASSWEGTHHASSRMPNVTWSNTISATYEVLRGHTKGDAYTRFLALVASRIAVSAANGQFWPVNLSISDSLHSQSVTFSLTYTFTASDAKLGALGCGLFLPLPGNGWPDWAASAAASALAARGNAQLAYDPASDSVIDLCASRNFGVRAGGLGDRTLSTGADRTLRATMPPPEKSFAMFTCSIEFDCDEGTRTLRTVPFDQAAGPPAGVDPGYGLTASGERPVDGVIRPPDPFAAGPAMQGQAAKLVSDILAATGAESSPVQKRANRAPVVRVRGEAVRVGYPIVPPRLLACAGHAAVLQRPRYATAVVANGPGVPLIGARWDDTYILPGAANGDIPIPGNPLMT